MSDKEFGGVIDNETENRLDEQIAQLQTGKQKLTQEQVEDMNDAIIAELEKDESGYIDGDLRKKFRQWAELLSSDQPQLTQRLLNNQKLAIYKTATATAGLRGNIEGEHLKNEMAMDSARRFESLLDDPDGLKKALELYSKEKTNYTIDARRESIKEILILFLFRYDKRLDLSGGRMEVSDPDGRKNQEATDSLKTVARSDLIDTLNLIVGAEYPEAKLDPKRMYQAICESRNIQLTGNTTNDRAIIYAAPGLSPMERSWLLNYTIDPSSVSLSKEKQGELSPQAEKSGEAQVEAREKLAKDTKVEWTKEDFKDPGKAFGKLLANGGTPLILGGGLWLLLSCFGMETSGKGNFFMKLLATVAGIGVAKGTGLWDFAYNSIAGTEGTVGGTVHEKVVKATWWTWDKAKEVFGSAVSGSDELLQKLSVWYKYSNFQSPDYDGVVRPVQELNFLSLKNRLTTSNGSIFTHKKDRTPMASGDYTDLQVKMNELYQDGLEKIKEENPNMSDSAAIQKLNAEIANKTVTQMIIWTTDKPEITNPPASTPANTPAPTSTSSTSGTTTPAPAGTPGTGRVPATKPTNVHV